MKKTLLLLYFICFSINGSFSQTNFYVTITNESGPGSITEAITLANQNPGKDSILFNIPGIPPHYIFYSSGIPEINDPLIIDGTSQPKNGFSGNSPLIVLDGNGCYCGGPEYAAMIINARSCELYGILFHNIYYFYPPYTVYGVAILIRGDSCVIGKEGKPNYFNVCEQAIRIEADSIFVRNNFIGVDTSNSTSSFVWSGISATADSVPLSDIYIEHNVIGCSGGSISFFPSTWQFIFPAFNNIYIRGNLIGINNDTLNPVQLNNPQMGGSGVGMAGVSGLFFGGDDVNQGNIVAGKFLGLQMSDCIAYVYGNKFGTNYFGTDTISNFWYGINILNPQFSQINNYSYVIGGTLPRQANLFGGKRIGIKNWENISPVIIKGNFFGLTNGASPLFLENGINIESSPSFTIIDSNFFSVSNRSINISGGDHSIISNNKFGMNVSSDIVPNNEAIYLQQSNHVAISDNIITNSHEDAISIIFSDSNKVLRNSIQDNRQNGVFLATSNKVTISHNSIFGNEKGIQLQYNHFNYSNDSLLPPKILYSTIDSIGGTTTPNGIIEIYYSLSSDLSPQGKDYIGTDTADASGNWNFIGAISDPANVTATVTDSSGNTSEFSQSFTTNINPDPASGPFISITPNPASATITLSNLNLENNLRMCLYDMTGRQVLEKSITTQNKTVLDISELANGIFLMEIFSAKIHYHTKLVVSH